MKPAIALLIVLALLAGCTQGNPQTVATGSESGGGETPTSPTPTTPPTTTSTAPPPREPTAPRVYVPFAAPDNVTIYQETAIVNGTADGGRLSYSADADAMPATIVHRDDGTWSLTIKVTPGHTNVTVYHEVSDTFDYEDIVITRLVQGTVQVDFRGVPGHVNRDDTVWIDVDAHASQSYYDDQPVAHPDYANVHDLMVTWTNVAEIPVVYKPDKNLGQQLMQIDGVGDPTVNSGAFWCYELNGASATLGITGQEFHAGDVVHWALGCV